MPSGGSRQVIHFFFFLFHFWRGGDKAEKGELVAMATSGPLALSTAIYNMARPTVKR